MKKKVKLTNDTILIRPFSTDDIENLYSAVRESIDQLSLWMPWCHPDYSIEETIIWLRNRTEAWNKDLEYDFAVIDNRDASLLGGCGLNNINRCDDLANLGYWIRTSCKNQGIATIAVLLLAEFAFKELGLNRLEMLIASENVVSQTVARKVGAVKEGYLRKRIVMRNNIQDAILFSLISDDLYQNEN